jgi:hypothetical protein
MSEISLDRDFGSCVFIGLDVGGTRSNGFG